MRSFSSSFDSAINKVNAASGLFEIQAFPSL